jgi:putative transposase
MPRGARLDSPGTLHHVIVRGIERKEIVNDDEDRKNFLTRMGDIALETGTAIYAWVLMNNHIYSLEPWRAHCHRDETAVERICSFPQQTSP